MCNNNFVTFFGSFDSCIGSCKNIEKSIILIKGQSKRLKVTGTKKRIKWTSSKKSAVSVNAKGNVKALRKGKAEITAKAGKKKYVCKVRVETPKISKTSMTVSVGKTGRLTMKGTSRKVKWQSSNTWCSFLLRYFGEFE